MQFRCAHPSACSVSQATVRTTASSEPRPERTSKACGHAREGWRPCASGLIRCGTIGTEFGALDLHPIQNETDAARHRYHRTLRFPAAGKLCDPCSEPCRAPTVHHDRRSLAPGAPQIEVAGFGDPARDIALTRLVSRGWQAVPGPDLVRSGEQAGVIDRRSIGQCHDGADPGHGHHTSTGWVFLGETPATGRGLLAAIVRMKRERARSRSQ